MNAFNYMFNDKEFAKKALIYFVLVFLIQICATFLNYKFEHKTLCSAIFILFQMSLLWISSGYSISCSQSVIENKDNINIPFIKFWNDFVKGIGVCAGIILQHLCLILCALAVGIPLVIIAFVCGILGVSKIALLLIVIFGILVLLLLLAFLLAIIPALVYIYIKTEKILSFISFKKACSIIKENCAKYFKAAGLIYLIGSALAILSVVLQHAFGLIDTYNGELTKFVLVKVVLYSLVVSFIPSYMFFATAHIVANCSDAEVE